MKTIESTIETAHLSDSITISEETLEEIREWVDGVDKTLVLTEDEHHSGEHTTIGEYTVTAEVFNDRCEVSIISTETGERGVLVYANELVSTESDKK